VFDSGTMAADHHDVIVVDEDNQSSSDDGKDDDDYQSSSDDGKDESSTDDDEDEEEKADTNNINNCYGWTQHWMAILVAILATAWTHRYLKQQQQPIVIAGTRKSSSRAAPFRTPTQPPSSRKNNGDRLDRSPFYDADSHAHLLGFQRTANISFCGAHHLLSMDTTTRNNNNNLAVMDFRVPVSLLPVLQLHYAADLEQDDDYSSILVQPSAYTASTTSDIHYDDVLDRIVRLTKDHPQVQCIQQQLLRSTPQKSYVQGFSLYYKEPSLESMYPDLAIAAQQGQQQRPPLLQPASLSFTGFGAKFVNLSPQTVVLHWDGNTRGGNRHSRRIVGEIAPMHSIGTATTPGQSFSVTPVYDHEHALERWVVTADAPVVYYDPIMKTSKTTDSSTKHLLLSPLEQYQYDMHKLNQEFAKHYVMASGRAWLAHFPRPVPWHAQLPAQYIGQVLPSPTISVGDENNNDSTRILQMKVESVSPKVFTIPNFLSADECDALIQLALSAGLHPSTVYAGKKSNSSHEGTIDRTTRSSQTTWLSRNTATLTDRIYQRAAQVLHLDQALLEAPDDDDEINRSAKQHSLAESLQVIRYQVGDEYTAHHDFVYPASPLHRYQPTRFATLLIYLNDHLDDEGGGATVFPRAVTLDRHDGVRPNRGWPFCFTMYYRMGMSMIKVNMPVNRCGQASRYV
jgi:prolyl 4-hydroxylase